MSVSRVSTRVIGAVSTVFLVWGAAVGEANRLPYLDSSQAVETRVEDLLSRMTLEEKIGQLNFPYVVDLAENDRARLDACRRFSEAGLADGVGPAGGFFALPAALDGAASLQAKFANELQQSAVQRTRLGIPLLLVEEGTHGFRAAGATVFPEGLAIGSTWNLDLVERIYAAAAREARATSTHFLCTLVIEPIRDPRMGRNEEGYSEDPFLCSQIAKAIVRGTQGADVSAGDRVGAVLCHYPGQSEPVSGLERGAMEISERTLRNVFFPPWVVGIKEAGALGVMATFPSIDGIPAHSSPELLSRLLRRELDFEGIVLSEGPGFGSLLYEGVVGTQKEAGRLGIEAGVDVSIWFESAYLEPLIENVEEGKVSIETIDRSVRRILRVKFLMGLFEDPYVEPERAAATVHAEEHVQLALQTAREGIVLLKNENHLLPLSKEIESIAVIGPNADQGRNQLGDYIARTVPDVVTVLEGVRARVSRRTRVTHVQGCDVAGKDLNQIAEATDAARNADVALVVVGENRRTNGEGNDVASLDLTGLQDELVKAVVATGTPTVVVLINGRPLSIPWIAEHVPSIVEAWMCGERGGHAVAEVLFGDYNPSGRLPITVPRHVGQLPVYYNYKPSKAYWMKQAGYRDMSATPLFPFGAGLSFTEFEYSNLRIEPPQIGPSGSFRVRVDVKNVGDRSGVEVIQLYVNDVLSTVATPVKELKDFRRIDLGPGRSQTVQFTLSSSQLSLLDRTMKRVVEPGEFEVMIGSSSADIRLQGALFVTD